MNAILYGNLSVEIVSDLGTRLERVTLRQAATDLLRSRRPEQVPRSLMLGREREAAAAFDGIWAGGPVGFHAACGYGKTTLLQNVAAAASERGLAPSCIYLRADGDRIGDLLQHLVARLYVSDQPVKLTPQECAWLLGQVAAIIAVDDLNASPGQVGYLIGILPACGLVIGSTHPVLGPRGSSHNLAGLPEETALTLVASDLGRPLAAEELAAARRLVAAVDGQPLHLRQCAALVGEGRHSFRSLARHAAHDVEVLDRLSISALAQFERRALAVLALAAGALLPITVVETVGQIAYAVEWLESLHRRGLAEHRDDRFGLPVCKAGSYRQLLFKDLHLAASARELSSWLTAADPTAAESRSAAEAALAMIEFAAERRDWASVLRLARAAERVLFIAGRWEAWHHTLSRGLEAAGASADKAAEAFFCHQQGTLAFCQDQLHDARRLLQHALTLRDQIGDAAGADLTRRNLQLLEPPAPPRPPRPRALRRVALAVGSVLGALALAVGTVAIAGVLRNGQPTGRPTMSTTHAMGPGSQSGQPSNSNQNQSNSPGSGQGKGTGSLQFTPATLPAATVGIADSQQITAAGGKPPYSIAVAAGALPPGLSLSASGAISGTPTTAGSYQFTITAVDSSAGPNKGSNAYTLQVAPVTITITLSPTTLPDGIPCTSYDQTITASGGTAPYSFSVSSGSLSPGLSLSAAGVISGSPEIAANGKSYPFTVQATDSSATSISGSQAYTLNVMKGTGSCIL